MKITNHLWRGGSSWPGQPLRSAWLWCLVCLDYFHCIVQYPKICVFLIIILLYSSWSSRCTQLMPFPRVWSLSHAQATVSQFISSAARISYILYIEIDFDIWIYFDVWLLRRCTVQPIPIISICELLNRSY